MQQARHGQNRASLLIWAFGRPIGAMSIRGIFPAFMKQLRRQWKVELPGLSGIPGALGSMPKASTFYAGKEPASGRHVFVWIQASVKRPGEFTVNIVLSDAPDAPAPWRPLDGGAFTSRAVGLYRLGDLVGGSDKWWSLAPKKGFGRLWAAMSSKRDEGIAFASALADVTGDVKSVLSELRLSVQQPDAAGEARLEWSLAADLGVGRTMARLAGRRIWRPFEW